MKPILGCIADDITGATDLAVMLCKHGMPTMQYIGLPPPEVLWPEVPALVIALKSRTAQVEAAIQDSDAACKWLIRKGARQIYFKYCSTFDSNDRGNIGPVAEALLSNTGADLAPICPAFPANLRTVYFGHLFVGNQLLSDSTMRHHPLTPMTDANLLRVLGRQVSSERYVGLVPYPIVEKGAKAIRRQIKALVSEGKRFAVTDVLNDGHLKSIASACSDMPLVTGGSGLALGLPDNYRDKGWLADCAGSVSLPRKKGPAAILAGSCSAATQAQVQHMARNHPSFAIDPIEISEGRLTVDKVLRWAKKHLQEAPILIYSTTSPESVRATQLALGREKASFLVEQVFGDTAVELSNLGIVKLIIAGGETSGAVLRAMNIQKLRIGPEIEPGVPWTVSADDRELLLVLKSGNFGSRGFFEKALEIVS